MLELSPKARDSKARLEAFMDSHIYPNEERFFREFGRARRVGGAAGRRGAEAKGEGGGAVEPVPARRRARPGPDQPRIRAAVRDHGPLPPGARSLQLLGARHRQHGGAGALRHAGAAGALAAAAAGRRDPIVLRDDRAGGRLQRRHQHRELDRARRRRIRHQRPQVVHHRRDRSALQDHHLHGQDRSRTIPTGIGSNRWSWCRRTRRA